jgi:molybdopterin-guanine dinucleotide biosynthesis protein A
MSQGPVTSAVILAGGRSSRLGGTAKAGLHYRGRTLLDHAVSAAGSVVAPIAGPGIDPVIVVVGPPGIRSLLIPEGGVTLTREDPPFGGPVAGIAAGLEALPDRTGFTAVLACDMPAAGVLAAQLLAAALASPSPAVDGFISVDRGKEQPLAALYRTAVLRSAVHAARASGRLQNASVFSLIASLDLVRVEVRDGCTADVDDWDAARMIGITEAANVVG